MRRIYLDKVTHNPIKVIDTERDFIVELERVLERNLNYQEYHYLSKQDLETVLLYLKSVSPKYDVYKDMFERALDTELDDNQEIQLSIW